MLTKPHYRVNGTLLGKFPLKLHQHHTSITPTSMRILSTLFSATTITLCLLILHTIPKATSQQDYIDNHQLDCHDSSNSTFGNICNSITSCQSYLTFKSSPPHYNTPSSIAYLLNSTPPLIANTNNISDTDTIPKDTMITVPVNCTCSGHYYQHNASYTVKTEDENYFTLANFTYEALTTCQALAAQNMYGLTNLTAGLTLHVPLRCACPTSKQMANGIKYLLTYLVSEGEYPELIADIFGVDTQSLLDANKLPDADTIIYFFTPLMVPLRHEPPTTIQRMVPPPPPPPAPSKATPAGDHGHSSSSKKWTIVGTTVGAAALVFLVTLVVLFLYSYRRSRHNKIEFFLASSATETSTELSLPEGLRDAVESLTVYSFEELHKGTRFFSEGNRIKGSVYRACLKDDYAAVKVLQGGDVSAKEINILKRLNHANITRLSGLCVHQGSIYLVYEFAENGSLDDWIHSDNKCSNSLSLSWRQRVQIAHDVADALNYLHNYTNPPHIHKDLKSGNVLLDGSFRGIVCNFGLARVVGGDGFGEVGFQLTRHVVGTHGYMPPEYIENGVVSPMMDVFAFGVVILELLSGREAIVGDKNGSGEHMLSASVGQVLEGYNVREKLHAFMDKNLRGEYPLDLAYSMPDIAKRCVCHELNLRPDISQVLIALSKVQSSSLDWDPSVE